MPPSTGERSPERHYRQRPVDEVHGHQWRPPATRKTLTHIYGPYLRSIPPLPVGAKQGSTSIAATADGNDVGWVYTEASGTIKANTTTEKDDADRLYNDLLSVRWFRPVVTCGISG